MNTMPYEDADQDWEDGDYDDELPARPRRQLLSWWSAGLVALILGGIGFYVGIRVEKSKFAGGGSLAAALTARTGAGAANTGAAASGGSFASRLGGSGGGLFGGRGGGFAGTSAGGNASVGTVSSVNRNTIYVTDTSGNTIAVKLSGATTVRKTENVSKAKIFPGDTVVVSGVKGSNGTLSATTITDSGTRSGAGAGTNASSGTGGGGSAIGSLFGGG